MGKLSNEEFSLLVKEKQHNQLIVELSNIIKQLDSIASKESVVIEQKEDNKEFLDSINGIMQKLDVLNEIPSSIKIIGDSIVNKLEENKIKEWTFVIDRHHDGTIKSVHAKEVK